MPCLKPAGCVSVIVYEPWRRRPNSYMPVPSLLVVRSTVLPRSSVPCSWIETPPPPFSPKSIWPRLEQASLSIVIQDRADAATLAEQRIAAVAEQIDEEGFVGLLLAVAVDDD